MTPAIARGLAKIPDRCFMHITTLNAFCLWLPGHSGMERKLNCPTGIGSKEFIRKSKGCVYGIWVYKVLGIWKGYYRVTKSLVSCMKPWTEARERERDREREIKLIDLFGDRWHRGYIVHISRIEPRQEMIIDIWNLTLNLHTYSHFKMWAEKWTIMQEANGSSAAPNAARRIIC